MEILTWVAGIPLCLMLGITGIFKTTNQKVSIETRDRIGVSPGRQPLVPPKQPRWDSLSPRL